MKNLYDWCIENNSNIYEELLEDNKVSPNNISYGSSRKLWWKCILGHRYQTTPNNRTHGNSGCPYCANKRVLKGFNDVEFLYPQSVIDWDYEKNELEPSEVFPHSNKKYWFICTKGHSYDMLMHHKIKGANCPICSNQRLLSGYNDLKTTHPDIAMEWDYEKNEINPDKVFSGSHKKVWWKCKEGHSWQTYIYNRTSKNSSNCPICYRSKKKDK